MTLKPLRQNIDGKGYEFCQLRHSQRGYCGVKVTTVEKTGTLAFFTPRHLRTYCCVTAAISVLIMSFRSYLELLACRLETCSCYSTSKATVQARLQESPSHKNSKGGQSSVETRLKSEYIRVSAGDRESCAVGIEVVEWVDQERKG